MFSGIVEEVGRVVQMGEGRLVVGAATAFEGVRAGESLSVNGACLTATALENGTCGFDLMPETLRRTSLGRLQPEMPVNLERALEFGGRVGGHLVQGHVDGTGEILSVTPEASARLVRIGVPKVLTPYVVEKGFIAVDGVSLTVVSADGESFVVSLVDYTLRHTTLGDALLGDVVNLEADILAKYVESLLERRAVEVGGVFKEGGD